LRHEEKLAADVAQGAVHLAGIVREDPESHDLFGQAIGFRLGVAALDADQRQDPSADRSDGLAVDGDARLADALEQSDHAIVKAPIKR